MNLLAATPQLRAVLAAQVVASIGLAAGGAAGGLLAETITGSEAFGAAPLGFLVLGAGLSAPPTAAIMGRWGRRPGLVTSYLVGGAGAALVLVAAWLHVLPLLLAGNLLLGAGNTAVMLTRYVAADFSPPGQRGRAISTSLLAVAIGAIVGPNLLGPAGTLASSLGLPAPAGLYLVALSAFAVAPPILFLVPDGSRTVDTSARPDGEGTESSAALATAGVRLSRTDQAARLSLAVLASANLTMVAVMAVAPVHLHAHGHHLEAIGLVVSVHIAAMYAASPLLGRLSDRHGPVRLATVGAAMLIVAGLLPSVADMGELGSAALTLVVLGLGWNVQVVAGSALLADAVPASIRSRAEGLAELGMSVGAAVGSLVLAGPLVAAGGLRLLAAATVILNAPLLLILVPRRRPSWTDPAAGTLASFATVRAGASSQDDR